MIHSYLGMKVVSLELGISMGVLIDRCPENGTPEEYILECSSPFMGI